MRYARIALLSAALGLLPFATPAIAQLGHPTGCAQCAPVNVAAPAQDYYREGVPVIGTVLGIGVPAGATALAPETGVAVREPAQRRRVEVWDGTYPRQYHSVWP